MEKGTGLSIDVCHQIKPSFHGLWRPSIRGGCSWILPYPLFLCLRKNRIHQVLYCSPIVPLTVKQKHGSKSLQYAHAGGATVLHNVIYLAIDPSIQLLSVYVCQCFHLYNMFICLSIYLSIFIYTYNLYMFQLLQNSITTFQYKFLVPRFPPRGPPKAALVSPWSVVVC